MIRLCFRTLAYVALILMIVTAIFDAVASVASSQFVITSLGEYQALLFKNGSTTETTAPFANMTSYIPAWLIFGIAAALLYMIGYKRPLPTTKY